MTKVDIKRLDSITKNDTTATEQINDNFKALQEAIENTLSRDGTGPNFMDADLDMNSYRIINSADPVEDNDIVNLKYVEERIGGAVESAKTATAAATQAANSAQSALVSSTNAINTLRNAEEQLNNVIQYVDEAKQTIDETIDAAIEDVKQQALDAAQESIDTAAAQATAIVIDYANNEVKPQLNEIASNAAESAENASESAGLAANESGNAAISATDAQHYAEDSRIWAEGSDSEVKNVDGEHSSKVWSEMAKTSATSAASSAELARVYGNDKINQTHITNCITEIPQDIKLELNNGTLTLKAGSKVYVPNGAGVFNVVTIARDISVSAVANRNTMILYRNGSLQRMDVDYCYSGAMAPTPSSSFAIWYDTANNVIKYTSDTGSTWTANNISLPLCIAIETTTGFTSINQVFNGFGYIGSTVFALPGVKGLIPNGRNADGSLQNIEFTTTRVLTKTENSAFSGALGLNASTIQNFTTAYYDEKSNLVLNSSGINLGSVLFGTYSRGESGRITSFTPKTAFHAVDWSDLEDKLNHLNQNKANNDLSNVGNANSSFIEKSVRWGIPDYTRGISYAYNTNITAPCDMCVVPIAQGNEGWHGYFYINGVTVVDVTCSGAWISTCLGVFHVSKGDVFKVAYQGGTSLKGYPLKGTL